MFAKYADMFIKKTSVNLLENKNVSVYKLKLLYLEICVILMHECVSVLILASQNSCIFTKLQTNEHYPTMRY